jgi:hypothetical protein
MTVSFKTMVCWLKHGKETKKEQEKEAKNV